MTSVNLENRLETTEGRSNLRQLDLSVSKYNCHLLIKAIRIFKNI